MDFASGRPGSSSSVNSANITKRQGSQQQYHTNQEDQPQSAPQKTQADQDKDDDKARKKAEENLVQSWMDRLQLVSVITTFFAANEAQLLSITTPSNSPDQTTSVSKTANAMLTGALIFHSFSAIIAFLGAFVLVRYKVKEAKKDEHKEDGKVSNDSDKEKQPPPRAPTSTNPHLEQVGYWAGKQPPTHLLYQTHTVAINFAMFGFLFGVVGVVCYAWSLQARSVGIFSSACIGACALAMLFLMGPFLKSYKQVNHA